MLKSTLVTTAAAAAGLLTLTACVSSPEGAPGVDQFGHVHDLAFDEATDSLYIATHQGLFVLADGELAGPLGNHRHDFMSFALAPGGAMIAGGHPDASTGWGNHMGFAASDDRGETWESRSLTGEVDFHDIEFAGDGYVGYDSQTGILAHSADGVTWDSRDAFAVFDLAVSPDDADTWVATTPDGVMISLDAGATFAPLATAPAELVYLDWSADQGLWGMSAAGDFAVSLDAGSTWEAAGTAPGPGAIEVTADGSLYVATEDGLFVSSDRGATWRDAVGGAA